MDTRRVQQVGNKSLAITLPKSWTVAHGIRPRQQVFVEETTVGDLIVRGKPTAPPHRELDIAISTVKDVPELIVFAYIKNIERLRIHGDLTYAAVRAIKRVLEQLEGYEITHEDAKAIEIQFLFTDVSVDLPNVTRRMIYLLRHMHEALRTKDLETLMQTETAIDRLYHLSNRILFGCIADSAARERHGIRTQEDLFFIKDIARRLEGIGDRLALMASLPLTDADHLAIDKVLGVLDKVLAGKDLHELKRDLTAMKVSSKDREVELRVTRIRDLALDLIDNALDIEFNRVYGA